MTTIALAPVEQLGGKAFIHAGVEDRRDVFPESLMPEMVYPSQHSVTQHHFTNAVPALYVSHALPAVPIEGDGRTVANLATVSQASVISTLPVPLRPTVMYPGISSATIYPAATRGSYCSAQRRRNEGSGDFSVVEPQADDGSHDEPIENGKVAQEVCRYFMRTGTCGYGDKCRYHHPQSAQRPKLNSMGYPQREKEHACPFYLKNGWCGFGSTCKFNHPELPPLNLPTAAATLMPQVLAPVPYQTIPHLPYANVSPGGHYSTVAPTQATPMMHWPVGPTGVPVNVNPPPQSGMYHQPYVSLPVQAWPASGKDQNSPTLASHGTPTTATAQRMYQKPVDNHQEVLWKHTSPKSDDSAFSVVGRNVSLPRHHQSGVESKHALMPTIPIKDPSQVSVTTV